MEERTIAVFLPCRKGSVRVPDKNVRPFGERGESLLDIKLRQLDGLGAVHQIVVSSNDERVLERASEFSRKAKKQVVVDIRPDELGSSSTRTDDLIAYVPRIVDAPHILWTHVTSPFFSEGLLDSVVADYFDGLGKGYDSLMTVNRLQKFIWNEHGPVNYDLREEKWPRTQTLPVWWEVNSAAFVAPRDVYEKQGNRVGTKPRMFELPLEVAFDIDNLEEFEVGRKLWAARSGQ